MKFIELKLAGAYLIEPEQLTDERGFFARSFCKEEFAKHQLKTNIEQCNISFNLRQGTVRGMHYQNAPYAEAKLVRCSMGSICDIIMDLRKDSETYKQWVDIELTATNRNMLYIPSGFAHGFQTLEDNVEIFYHMFAKFYPGASSGSRWDDPAFSITWPQEITTISDKDTSYPDYIE